MYRVCLVILAGALALSLTPLAHAQVNWMSPLHEPGFSLEISKISFDDDQRLTFGTMQYSLSARFKVAENMSFLFEMPYVHFSRIRTVFGPGPYTDYYENSSSTVGNPYLGLESCHPEGGPVLKFGMRVPLASQLDYYASSYGMLAARDRWEAFLPKVTTIQIGGGIRISRVYQYRFQLLLLPSLMIPNSGDPELFLDMNAEYWLTTRQINAGIGLYNLYLVTESGYSFDDRNELLTGISLNAKMGRFHPGLHMRIPLDKYVKDELDFTYGLNLTVDLPSLKSDDSNF